jgi:hypothetical protein
MEALEAFLDQLDDDPNPLDLPPRRSPDPITPEVRRKLTANATKARVADRERNERRARELREKGLSTAQIAVRMTEERGQPQRPPIDARTVSRWLARKET